MPPATPGAARVAYGRQTLDHPNPLARFAHRARHRRSLALAAMYVARSGTILDFGAGTGELLHRLGGLRPDIRLLAFEPFMAVQHPGILGIAELETLPDASLDAVSAFEVCEHLEADQLDGFLAQTRRLLRPEGCLIVSVPVMEGLALPAKEASRALLFRRASDYRPAELLGGMFGRPVARAPDVRTSHKGFAHRALWRRLDDDYVTIESVLSPFPGLPWWVNSQRFGVFRPRGR